MSDPRADQSNIGAEPNVKEAVGVFRSAEDLQGAIDQLLSSGWDRADISLLASEKAVDERLGHHYEKVAELEDDPSAARTAYVEKESLGGAQGGLIGGLAYIGAIVGAGATVASGGALGVALGAAAAAGGAGGLIGSLFAAALGAQEARKIEEHLKHGGFLLWVRVWDGQRADEAAEILSSNNGQDVHIHTIVRRRDYDSAISGPKRKIVALFSSKGEAENAQHRLISEGAAARTVTLQVLKEIGPVPDSMDPEWTFLKLDPFFWFLGNLKEDYAQYIRNGETALSVEVRSDDEAEEVISILEAFQPIRVDQVTSEA